MAKPKQIIITEDGVITQEALVAYAAGKLSAEETVQIEKLLRDDPFAQDALEGIKSAAAPVEMQSIVTSLNMALREKTGVREKKKKGIEIHWATYAYAAVIVGILIGLGFVMIHFIADNDQRIAMNKKTTQVQESAPVTDGKPQTVSPAADTAHTITSGGPASGTNKTGMDSVAVVNGAVIPAASPPPPGPYTYSYSPAGGMSNNNQLNQGYAASTPVLADRKTAAPVSSTMTQTGRAKTAPAAPAKGNDDVKYTVDGHDLETGKEVKSQNYKSPVATNFESNLTEQKNLDQVSVSSAKKEKKREASLEKANATPADNAKAARTLFDANDFKEAGKAYNKILSDQPENPDALYFGGICDYYNGKGRQAEKNFDKLLKAGLYVDGAKWYKANVLIDHGKKDEGKQLLRDLINTNSSFKDRAVKKYEEVVK